MKICQYCGTPADDSTTRCNACNAAEFTNVCNNCHRQFTSAFCPKCGIKAGDTGKTCPRCGTRFFSPFCPGCGFNPSLSAAKPRSQPQPQPANYTPGIAPVIMRNESNYSACRELCARLDAIEASRPKKGFLKNMVSKVWMKDSSLEPTDQQKIEAISSFVIPNIKTEIIDFITLADSKIKTCESLMFSSNDDYVCEVQESLLDVWEVKRDEAMRKGDALLSNDKEYLQLRWTILSEKYKEQGLCRYCGGRFKGVFRQVCSNCGRNKDY